MWLHSLLRSLAGQESLFLPVLRSRVSPSLIIPAYMYIYIFIRTTDGNEVTRGTKWFLFYFFLLKIKTKNRNHQSFALRLHDPTTYGLHSWHSYVVTSFRYSATLLISFLFMFLTRIKVIYTNTSLYQRYLWEKRAHKCSMDRACRYICRRSPQEIPLQPTTPANHSSQQLNVAATHPTSWSRSCANSWRLSRRQWWRALRRAWRILRPLGCRPLSVALGLGVWSFSQ